MSKCEWKDDGELWGSECGRTQEFPVDGPIENGFKFCPSCGREVFAVPKQPKILTAEEIYQQEMENWEIDSGTWENHCAASAMRACAAAGIKYGERDFYYRGGYEKLVEMAKKARNLLGGIPGTPIESTYSGLDNALKNLKKPE